jgi:hypothetical protein
VAPSSHVSLPHMMPSPHTGFEHKPPLQYVQSQSVPTVHTLPGPHFGQMEPPQSTSVSVWFLRPSEQLWAWHLPPVHLALLQSASVLQA